MYFQGLASRHLFFFFAIMLTFGLLCQPVLSAETTFDYDQMAGYIRGDNLEEPLVLFTDDQGEFDYQLNKENLAYLNQNPGLLEHIQQQLAADSLNWKLSESSRRLLVVPEQRQAYAELFERYCKMAVSLALALTELPNPYNAITTLREPVQADNLNANKGVTAYLVHNIADEYLEEYTFFNPESDSKEIKIKLRNRVFTGKIGSYTSKLTIGENYTVEFERESYTLWQDNANNPVNVFVAPVEETFHIALRKATENAIRAKIAFKRPQSIEEVERIAEEWIAVEEAMVGGLVAKVMPIIFSRLMPGLMDNEMSASLDERDVYDKYRFLKKGVSVISEMGIQSSIELYTANPEHFKTLVCPPSIAAPPSSDKIARNG